VKVYLYKSTSKWYSLYTQTLKLPLSGITSVIWWFFRGLEGTCWRLFVLLFLHVC